MSRSLKWIIVFGLVIAALWGAWHLYVRNHRLSFVPEAMGVSRVVYASEEAWGFGPGANETGIFVYVMPKVVAEQLQTRGVDYLRGLPQQVGGGWRGSYTEWLQTPVLIDGRWPSDESVRVRESAPFGIADYLFRYGFEIPLDREVERMVDEAIFRPGSYYAHGRTGMIIVIPAAERIVYAYSG